MKKREVVTASGVRTAIGEYGGSLKDIIPAVDSSLIIAELSRLPIKHHLLSLNHFLYITAINIKYPIVYRKLRACEK